MLRRALTLACLLSAPLLALADVCAVEVTGPAFGIYDPTSPRPTDAVGLVRLSCKSGGTITISPGGSGTYFPRAMRSGASTLAYNLFVDAARTGIWGDWGTGAQVRFVAEGTDRTIPIFARIPPQQNPDSGDYADTLVVTVYF